MDLQKGTQTVNQYLRQAKSIADSLVGINELIPNKDLVTGILCGLGLDYKLLVTTLLNFHHLPNFAGLHSQLLSYKAQTPCTDPVHTSQSTTLMATQSQPFFSHCGGSSNHGTRRGRRGGRCSRGRGGWGWNS